MGVKVVKQTFQILTDEDNQTGSIPLFTGLAKGDLLVYMDEGDVRRLPVGSSGQVLTVDPTAELGVKWADPS